MWTMWPMGLLLCKMIQRWGGHVFYSRCFLFSAKEPCVVRSQTSRRPSDPTPATVPYQPGVGGIRPVPQIVGGALNAASQSSVLGAVIFCLLGCLLNSCPPLRWHRGVFYNELIVIKTHNWSGLPVCLYVWRFHCPRASVVIQQNICWRDEGAVFWIMRMLESLRACQDCTTAVFEPPTPTL